VRRLFSTFAYGAPGVGLLLLRLAVGIVLVDRGVTALLNWPPLASVLFYSSLAFLGVLLLVGLWTPIAAGLVALSALWEALSQSASWRHCVVVGITTVALTLLGPGAWSIDAWLYGWRRIRISDRRRDRDPPV
jgi:putative oxidoreductase